MTLLSNQNASAQKLPSTLLWRISGNSLQNPSYLYGTMHLTDERIFNLGDSLYSALEKSEGFATEIDPSEFTSLLINETKKSLKNKILLKDFLSPEKFKKYGKLLADKLKKDENKITTSDILDEKNKWSNESLKNGKMKTFLDMYLYDIARRKGKWTSGVEDPQDQGDLEDPVTEEDIEQIALYKNYEEFTREQNEEGNFFINAYINNDLNMIDSISNLSDTLSNDVMLVRRNIKMAARMDSMSHIRSTVFAIGAAHLPGKKGLIELLREKGFSVTPVFSSKKIKPSDYKVEEIAVRWYNTKDEDSLYTAEMPGIAGDMTFYGIMKMKMFYDAFSSTVYMTSALTSPLPKNKVDSVLNSMAKEFFSTEESPKGKPITIDNVTGLEYESTSGSYSRGYLLYENGKIFMALAKCQKEDTSAAGDIRRFLHSFSINKIRPVEEKNFYYVNKTKAYQLTLPAPPQSAAELIGNADSTIKSETFFSIDPASGTYFFFGTNESAPGYFIVNDSLILSQIQQTQIEKMKIKSIDSSYMQNGYKNLVIGGLMLSADLMMKAQFRFRGNRWYALVVVYDSSKDQSPIQQFFDSFSTLDYAKINWTTQASEDSLFHTWAPSKFSSASLAAGELNRYTYHSFDSTRGDSYTMILENFDKYLWYNNDSTFWASMIKPKKSTDRLLSKKKVQNGTANGYEYLIQEEGSSNVKRVRMLLNGDRMFSLITIQDLQEINNDNNNQFFETFRVDRTSSGPGLFISKAELLLNDIASENLETADKAREYLSQATFTKDNLQLLQQTLLLNFTEGSNIGNTQLKRQLSRIIINLEDSSSFHFARNNYPVADDTTRNELLNIMVSFPTQENFIILKNILKTYTPRVKPDNYFSTGFTDSVEIAAIILPDLLPLLKDTVMAPSIIAITKTVLEKGLIKKALLSSYEPELLHLSKKYYNALEKYPDDYRFVDYDLQELIAKLNTVSSNAMLQNWSNCNQIFLRYFSVIFLLQNNQPIKANAVQALAENKITRISLYDSLKTYKKLSLFPAKYATQQSFAESLVFNADDDEYGINKVIFLSEKIIEVEGKKSKFYFYKMIYGEEDEPQYLLSAAGPFSLNIKDLSTKETEGFIYDEENFNETKLKEQMDALIQQIKDHAKYRKDNTDAD